MKNKIIVGLLLILFTAGCLVTTGCLEHIKVQLNDSLDWMHGGKQAIQDHCEYESRDIDIEKYESCAKLHRKYRKMH